jgi:hypothetical protein
MRPELPLIGAGRRNSLGFGWAAAVGLVLGAAASSPVSAQPPGGGPVVLPNAPQSPPLRINVVDALASRIYSRADLTRAVGEFRLNTAQALYVTTQAIKQDIINAIERKNAKWERRTIEEAERLKRKVSHLQSIRTAKSRYWERLEENADRAGTSIVDGEGLNLLLDRLAGTFYAYQFAEPGSPMPESWTGIDQLTMDASLLTSLRVKQDLPNGQRLVFRPIDGVALGVDVWPVLLRKLEFDLDRAAFVAARERAVDDAGLDGLQRVSPETLAELRTTLDRINGGFHRHYDKSFRMESMDNFLDYAAAAKFLKSLDGELRQLARLDSKSNQAFDGSLKFDGADRSLGEFVQYMARAGLRFAPAEPGDEPAYHQMFRMMRDLYAAVGKDDKYVIGWEDLSGNASLAKRVAEANLWRERARHERNEPEFNGRDRELETKLEVKTDLKDK